MVLFAVGVLRGQVWLQGTSMPFPQEQVLECHHTPAHTVLTVPVAATRPRGEGVERAPGNGMVLAKKNCTHRGREWGVTYMSPMMRIETPNHMESQG